MDKKTRVKKTLLALCIILILSIAATAISFFYMGGDLGIFSPTIKDYPADTITSHIITQLDITNATKIQEENISKHYTLPDGLVDEISLYTSSASDIAFELGCFKLTDERYKEQMLAAVADHMAQKAAGFETVNPAGYELYKNYLVEQVGVYTFVFVGQNREMARTEFKKLIN